MNLKRKLLEGREKVTKEKLKKIGKKENRIERSAEKLVAFLIKGMIFEASVGGNERAFSGTKREERLTGWKKIELIDTGAGKAKYERGGEFREEVFKRALKKARERYENIKFDLKETDENEFEIIAKW